MGLLGDITAYIDNLKRRGSNTLADLATNPLGLLSRNLSAFSESLPAAPDSVMPGGGGLLNRPGFQQWGMDVALNAPTMGLLGHTVYHGSPYKFKKFDASKIGTGEGAQAYGYGTYLAEAKDVGNSYRNSVNSNLDELVSGAIQKNKLPEDVAEAYAAAFQGGKKFDSFLADVRGALSAPWSSKKDKERMQRVLDHEVAAADAWSNWKKPGSLYTVDLPDEWLPKMLDWDKPLSQQPEIVRQWFDSRGIGPGFAGNQSGAELMLAENRAMGGQDAVARSMREFGIPGVKYLDHGSRFNAADGLGPQTHTRNFVVFPGMEGLLKILSRE